jgi:pyruvate dehydrogenase E2 component (dihydrolipoamide acetyltransferase)
MAIPVKMQRLSKVSTVGEIAEWLKAPGDEVREGEPLLKVLSEKATVEVEAPASGVLLQIVTPRDTEAPVGAVLAWIGEAGESIPGAEAQPAPAAGASPAEQLPETQATTQPEIAGRRVRATPVARRVARDRNIPLHTVAGTGPGGIITRSDVEQATRPAVEKRSAAPIPPLEPSADTEMRPLSGIQRIMLGRMELNLDHVAQSTTVAEIDMTEIAGTRDTVPATYTAWVILATARALAEYPILNASLQENQLAYHPGVQMGVSVETDAGLMVPVIHDVHTLGLAHIQAELSRLVQVAREGQLEPADVQGATFTMTNSGVLGSVLYTPMIVPPQGAILGMGRVAKQPVVRNDQIVIRSMMYLCLSYDHRYIAGGVAVRYLQRVRQYLENPVSLLWE